MLGNKCDADKDRHTITERKAAGWCEEKGGIPHFRVSAKDGTNVEQAFLAVVKTALKRVKVESDVFIPDTINLDESRKGSGGGGGGCDC